MQANTTDQWLGLSSPAEALRRKNKERKNPHKEMHRGQERQASEWAWGRGRIQTGEQSERGLEALERSHGKAEEWSRFVVRG